MNSPNRTGWFGMAMVIGLLYAVVGVGFAALANPAGTEQTRFAWRLAAWVISAALFAIHIGYENFHRRSSPPTTALHAALAVALGAFLLAISASVHSTRVASHAPYWRFLIALVAWPLLTGVPAFLVAAVAGAILAQLRRTI